VGTLHSNPLLIALIVRPRSLWRVDLDGAKAKARILVTSTREQYGPLISPDGRRIVFMSNRSGSFEIWVCDSNGSNAQQLTSSGRAPAGTPRWSPDRKQIVFDSRVGALGTGRANLLRLVVAPQHRSVESDVYCGPDTRHW
jgi:Tol biopolymer transport system component